jgi:hypothetical protein
MFGVLMSKMLISIPDGIASRFKTSVPAKQRSKVIVSLLEKELIKRERLLYECALAIENDSALQKEAQVWDHTVGDGLENESW